MMIALLVTGGTAALAGTVISVAARARVPRPFRSIKRSIAVSLSCVSGKHDRCGDHLACPCACHDHAIHHALTSPSRPSQPRPATPFVERD